MKRFSILLAVGVLTTCASGQIILRTNVEGVAVQSFTPGQAIDGFSVSAPDQDGYVYLVAHAGSQSGEVIRTRWQGTGFQAFEFASDAHLTGFDVRGPDAEGYVYLKAIGSDGSTYDMMRSQLTGVAVHSFISPHAITFLEAYGPDDEGCVYLVAGSDSDDSDPARTEVPEFALAEIGPCTDMVRISYSVARSCHVKMVIYDASGRMVAEAVDDYVPAGAHQATWNTSEQNAGVYFVQMNAGAFTATRKLVVVK